jgi:hypothetical protein
VKNPVQAALVILFLGGAAAFVVWAFDSATSELRRLDTIAQVAGFNDDDELKAARAKGFSQPAAYRDAVKQATDARRLEGEQKTASAAKAKAEADADKKLRQARFEEGAVYAVALKKGMKNPDSFKLESVRRTGDGVFCFEYRAANSFNAIIPGKALFGAGRAATSDQGTSFAPLWNKFCTKSSEDFDTIVYAMKNGYFQ